MDTVGILILALIWGSSFLFIKIGLNGGMPPLLVASMRLTLGATLMWVIVLIRRIAPTLANNKPIPHDWATWGKLVIVGLFNNAIPFALISWGEQRISSGLASIFNASMPLFTVVFAHWITHDDRITSIKALGIFVGFAGVAVVILPSAGDLTGELLGCLAVIVASASYAIATVYVKKNLTGATDPIATGAGQLTTALIWLLPLVLLTGATTGIGSVPVESILAVTVLGLMGTGLAYVIYYLLIQRAKASQLSLVTYLLPVTALIYGAIFLQEQITVFALAGFALIVTGIILVNRANRQASRLVQEAASLR